MARSCTYSTSTRSKAPRSTSSKPPQIPPIDQPEPLEFMAKALGSKRVTPTNLSGSQLVKKRKIIDLTQVDNEDGEEDELAAAAAQAALAGKNCSVLFYMLG